MATLLNEKEVNRLYKLLTDDQMEFLNGYLKQSKKSKWLEKLAHRKGIVIHSQMPSKEIWEKLNDWELVEILDGGYGERPYKCECGMTLRYCFVVSHRDENKTYHLGETCLGNYTKLSPDLIKDITIGFHKIDLERDDILKKYQYGWKLPVYLKNFLLLAQLQAQIDVGLPLSDAQVFKIEKEYEKELQQIRREKQMGRIQWTSEQLNTSRTYSKDIPTKTIDRINYNDLIIKHLDQLRVIREHERMITNPSKKMEWKSLQEMVLSLKRNEHFNYSKFLSQMFDLLYYLKLY